MISTFQLYWKQFLDPTFKDVEIYEKEISLAEFIGINWFFAMIKALYVSILTFVGAIAPKYMGLTPSKLTLNNYTVKAQSISQFFALFEIILFPIAFYFLYRFWVFLLKFFAELYECEEPEVENICRKIVKRTYSVNFLYFIPFIGSGLSILAQALYLYLGLRHRLKFTNLQSISVLLIPIVIIGCFAVIIISYIFFIFSLLFAG